MVPRGAKMVPRVPKWMRQASQMTPAVASKGPAAEGVALKMRRGRAQPCQMSACQTIHNVLPTSCQEGRKKKSQKRAELKLSLLFFSV